MNQRILSLCIGIGLFTGTTDAQLQRIVLQGAGTPQIFTDLSAALAASQPNDKLYLSGGNFQVTGNLVIDRPLHFIGAGIHPDSSSVTSTTTITVDPVGTTGDIVITSGASGSTFTGLVLAPYYYIQYGTGLADDDPTDLLFQRCRFLSRTITYFNVTVPSASSTVFDECIFNRHINGYIGGSGTFTRCILDYQTGTSSAINGFGILSIDHCVFLDVEAFRNSPNATMENSICTDTNYPVYQSNNITLTNCIFSGTTYTGNSSGAVVVNCALNVPVASIFINETDLNYQFTDDLHLTPGSGGIGGADDGTDIGIYGSGTPYKPGAVPYNPHFRSAVIAPATNANGDLPVNIRVAAQTN
ncbi:MAG: hypothetical protein R2818_07580 [Flavobacteriales bacterium]